MLKAFRSNDPTILFTLALLAPPLLLFTWNVNPALVTKPAMPLQHLVEIALMGNIWSHRAVFLILVVFCAIRLNALTNKLGLFDQKNHLPALFFTLCAFSALDGARPHPVLMGMPFIIHAIQRSWAEVVEEGAISKQFDAGMLLGIAVLFHLGYLLLLPAFWIGMAFMRTYRWREWVFLPVGTALVLALTWSVYFLLDEAMPFTAPETLLSLPFSLIDIPLASRVFWGISAGLVLWALYWYLHAYQHSKMRRKNIMKATGAVAFFSLGVLVFSGTGRIHTTVLALPLATLFGFLFLALHQRRAWLANLLFYLWCSSLLWSMWAERVLLVSS